MNSISSVTFLYDPLNTAYNGTLQDATTHDQDATNWLDIDQCYLENTQHDESVDHLYHRQRQSSNNDTTLSSNGSVARCEQYAVNRHFYVINNSPQVCEPTQTTSPKPSHLYGSYEEMLEEPMHAAHSYEHEMLGLPIDSCYLFATNNSGEECGHSTIKSIAAKSTPNDKVAEKKPRFARPTVSCVSNAKKIFTKFTKKFRLMKKVPTKQSKQPVDSILVANKKHANAAQQLTSAPPKKHQIINNQLYQVHPPRYNNNYCASHQLIRKCVPIETPKKAEKIRYLPKSQPSQFSSHNYEVDTIFDRNNNQFKALGDIVTYYI